MEQLNRYTRNYKKNREGKLSIIIQKENTSNYKVWLSGVYIAIVMQLWTKHLIWEIVISLEETEEGAKGSVKGVGLVRGK